MNSITRAFRRGCTGAWMDAQPTRRTVAAADAAQARCPFPPRRMDGAPSAHRPRTHRFTTAAAAAAAAATNADATSPTHLESSVSPTPPPPPPPIVWTTHRLTPIQIRKVDELFHKLLWLDMIETAILVDVMNAKLGRVHMTSKQKSMLERRMNSFGLEGDSAGEGGATLAGEASDAAPKEEAIKLVDVKLVGYDDKQKIKVIKEVRSILGLGLKEAKEMVESAPKVLSKQVKPDQAQELMEQLVAAGAQVEVS